MLRTEQTAFDFGLMDAFPVTVGVGSCGGIDYGKGKGLVMGYYDGNTTTALWNYAQHFAMSDNSFGTTFGPSSPGALNLASGQTGGVIATGSRVEMWRGGLGAAYLLPALSSAGASLAEPCSVSTSRSSVGSRTGARTVGGGFPAALFRLRDGGTVPPWPRFQFPPRQTGQADFPHPAFLSVSPEGL
jgi:hypothetical protein